MEDTRNNVRTTFCMDIADIPKYFNSIDEVCIYGQLHRQAVHGVWQHNAINRELIAKRLNIAEITIKVALRSMLIRGVLTKLKKAQYKLELNDNK